MRLFESFHDVSRWALLLLLLVPVFYRRFYLARKPAAMAFSSLPLVAQVSSSWRARLMWLLPVLRTLAIVLLIVALARPRKGNEQTRVQAEGIAIQLVADRSGSMQAMDFRVDGKPVDRLTAERSVIKDFVLGDGTLNGHPDDLIGLITFARFADSRCPLTLDHGYLMEALEQTQIASTREEDGTAIGDAVALGVERIRSLDEQRRSQEAQRIKSRIMILLTDGENNAGDVDPIKAAELAATYNVKVYTIGTGTHGTAPFPVVDPFGQRSFRSMEVSIDEDMLRKMAEITGGKYFRATDVNSLRNIYAEIDKLEKTQTLEKRYFQYKEYATQWIYWGAVPVPPLLLIVFALLAIEVVLSQTWLRRIP